MTASDHWRQRGGIVRAGRVAHFSRADDEASWLLDVDRAAVVPLTAVLGVRVTGPDRIAFLQGQLSNDLNGLPTGGCQPTLQLNVRGQVVAEATLCRREGDVYLAVEDDRGGALLRSLAEHIVFDDVSVEDVGARLTTLTVQGGAAVAIVERALGPVPEAGSFAQLAVGDATVLQLRRPRCARGGVDVHLVVEALPAVVDALLAAGAGLAGERALTLARVLAGIPAAASEAAGGVLPQEAGLEPYISYRKGCYLGQEIMARIEARGNVRRGLVRLRLGGGRDEVEALEDADDSTLRVGERPVGVLGSAAFDPVSGGVALAVARRDLADDTMLLVGGIEARLERMPDDTAVASVGSRRGGL